MNNLVKNIWMKQSQLDRLDGGITQVFFLLFFFPPNFRSEVNDFCLGGPRLCIGSGAVSGSCWNTSSPQSSPTKKVSLGNKVLRPNC